MIIRPEFSDTAPEIPVPNPAAVIEEGDDGWTLLVNPDTAGSMALNQTGVMVWRLVDGRRTSGEIAAAIRARFPDAPDTVKDDVLALLVRLTKEGFVGQEVQLRSIADE